MLLQCRGICRNTIYSIYLQNIQISTTLTAAVGSKVTYTVNTPNLCTPPKCLWQRNGSETRPNIYVRVHERCRIVQHLLPSLPPSFPPMLHQCFQTVSNHINIIIILIIIYQSSLNKYVVNLYRDHGEPTESH